MGLFEPHDDDSLLDDGGEETAEHLERDAGLPPGTIEDGAREQRSVGVPPPPD